MKDNTAKIKKDNVPYAELSHVLQKALLEYAQRLDLEPRLLYSPQQYLLSLGGKRLRPLLVLIANDLYQPSVSDAIPAALAVELFHNFSLIHDDIMDKAPLRRGQQTVHEKWNSNIAILSGDAMLVKAYEQLALCKPVQLLPLLETFNQTAIQVCEGQQMDMDFETRTAVNTSEYITMISLKTAVLLGGSLKMGALIGGAPEQELLNLYEFGKNIGIAFQLQDDLLDVFGDNEKFGKQPGGDILSNKKTYLLLKAMEKANAQQKQQLHFWLGENNRNEEKIQAVTQLFHELKVQESTNELMQEYYRLAEQNLQQLTCPEQKKKQLLEFANSLLKRES